uniref:Copia protein n=1 Tax=Tanacetum cinerariifolium TaxID=118510 RepID=A0A6L2LC57_TANCI|nr:copia protein [Tanacetum cinerariifolium]
MIIKKDSEIVKAKVERKSLALKAKKESSEEECSTSGSEDEEYAMTSQRSRDDKNDKSDRKCFRCGDPNHLIGECPKPLKDKNQRAFVGGSWSDSREEDDEKVKNETCLVAQASSEVFFETSCFSDENSSIDDLALDNEYDKLRKMRLDIMFSVCLCARFQKAPKTSHLESVKHIFQYIKGTTHLGLWYPKGTSIETVVYADSDHANRNSTSGIFTFVGYCLTSWFSKKQTTLAISTTEAEYVSAGKAYQQGLWMKQALIDYDV